MSIELRSERLTLRVPELSEGEGRRLAQIVASRLGTAQLPDGARSRRHLRLRLAEPAGRDLDALADRIVTELMKALEESAW